MTTDELELTVRGSQHIRMMESDMSSLNFGPLDSHHYHKDKYNNKQGPKGVLLFMPTQKAYVWDNVRKNDSTHTVGLMLVHTEIISVFDWGTKNENRLEMYSYFISSTF